MPKANMKQATASALLLMSSLLYSTGANANTPVITSPEMQEFRERIYDDWCPSKAMPVGTHVDIACSIASDGKLYDVKLEHSSGDAQLDADCVQAVLGVSAFRPMHGLVREGELCLTQIYFDSTTRVGHKNSGIAKYFAAHPEHEADRTAFYKMPLDVLERYPGLLTEDEVLADGNIGNFIFSKDVLDGPNHGPGLSDNTVDQLRIVYQGIWIPFFLKFPSATKEQVLEVQHGLGEWRR
ncbi:MAG TPA: TonB C-terminal domain-containing protein [Planktothrix sp.]|jgi:hypothetical protein